MSESSTLVGSRKARHRLTPGGVLSFFAYLLAAGLVGLAIAIFSGQLGARVVLTNSMAPTLNPGDLVVSANWLKPIVGEVAIYEARNLEGKVRAEFVHRVIAGSAATEYTFKGDNNPIADPFPAKASSVVGVVKYTIPKAGIFLQPIYLAGFFVGLVLIYFLVAYIRHQRAEASEESIESQPEEQVTMEPKSKLSGGVKSLIIWLSGLVFVFMLLGGLAALKVLGFEHPVVGPNLPIGNANSTIVAIVPGGTARPGQYAIANLNGERNFVRVDGVTATGYEIATMDGKATISADKLDGPMLFFIPFIGYLWLPFGA
ncbi:MAG: hypothetical protein RL670_994 [Actinomycetota bacterium]